MKNEFEQIKDKLSSNKAESLNIYRVPSKCAKIFKEFANENFAGDYGATLSFFMYNYLDVPATYLEIYNMVLELSNRISELELKVPGVDGQASKIKTKVNIMGEEIHKKIMENR